VFTEHGYVNPRGWEAKVMMNQMSQRKWLSDDFYVDFDVHLKISNNKRLENTLSLNQLLNSNQTDKDTGSHLVGFAHALLHAIFHLMNHRSEGDLIKLIWYYDIFLLNEKLNEQENNDFLQLVNEAGLSKVTIKALELTTQYFDSLAIHKIISALDPTMAAAEFDSMLTINSKKSVFLENLKNQPSLKIKWLLVKEMAFPPPAGIYAKYGRQNKQPLILLYVRRIVGGIIKYLRYPDAR
jgi:hypothetical protein